MSDPLQALIDEIRALRATYDEATARAALAARAAHLPPEQRAWLEAHIFGGHVGNVTRAAGGPVQGQATLAGDSRLTGANVGVNQGTVQLFFGAQAPADGKELLDSYLRALVAEHGRLRLGKLLGKEQSGREQTTMPPISLLKVFTSLTTEALIPVAPFTLGPQELLEQMQAADPARVLPAKVLIPALDRATLRALHADGRAAGWPEHQIAADGAWITGRAPDQVWEAARRDLEGVQAPQTLSGHWYRPEQPLDAIRACPRLVLLGGPGSGKSTLLRYLAVSIAEALLRGRDPAKPLPIPFFCPLGPVAGRLSNDPEGDLEALIDALLRPVLGPAGLRAGLRDSVLLAWRKGGALICLDGLDEVPGALEATTQGRRSRRERIAEAIRRLDRQLDRSRLVVTCRTRPYEQDAAWQLRDDWALRRLQPFAFGQVRHFTRAWYAETCGSAQALYTLAEAEKRAQRLVEVLERREVLRELTTSPLLLTMLALLDYNKKEMPEKRVDVYEELVRLLLDRWEGVRSSDVDRRQQSIGERLELPRLSAEDLRPVLHQLAFAAHQQEVDGRGVLSGALLRDTLDAFFRARLNPTDPRAVPREEVVRRSDRFIHILREETGLVLEEADETYVLPHLTFEEYLAACHLAGQENPDLIYQQWAAGGDRWREVALLLMGRLARQEKRSLAFSWLLLLVSPRRGLDAKPALQRQRDALLAAACYAELGRRGAFVGSAHDVLGFEEQLRAALVELLERPDPSVRLPQRLEAGTALGLLGDPRYPVEDAQWQAELGRLSQTFGRPEGYFCYVPGGRYRIGGWEEKTGRATRAGVELALQPFWIARFPVTVAQYAAFVAEGYRPGAERWWAPEGWERVINLRGRTAPSYWEQDGYHGPNQPVVGVSWHEATAYCAWLSERLKTRLPPGHVIRLPTEAEWETAASFDGSAERRPYPWGREAPTPGRAIYAAAGTGAPAPVGCCPAGAAACGALDMAGNVWEVCANDYDAYPAGAHEAQKDFTDGRAPWRGGSWYNNETSVRCGARVRYRLDFWYVINIGFRVVLASSLAHMS